MRRAKDAGIDAFALNIGVDGYTDQQLGYAYDSAAKNGMKVFISFDFNWWSPGDAGGVGRKIAQYASKPAQLVVDGRVFASSFAGDGLDVDAMRSAAGSNVYFVPNFHPGQSSTDKIDGALNWMVSPARTSHVLYLHWHRRVGIATETTRRPPTATLSRLLMETTRTKAGLEQRSTWRPCRPGSLPISVPRFLTARIGSFREVL